MPAGALPIYVGSRPRVTEQTAEVRHKYDGSLVAVISQAGDALIDEAIQAAVDAQRAMSKVPAHARREALLAVAEALRARREEFATTLLAEVGKPIALCRGEVDRATDTFTNAAEEATRLHGEFMPLDVSPRGAGY